MTTLPEAGSLCEATGGDTRSALGSAARRRLEWSGGRGAASVFAALLVGGCATTEKQLYVDWIAVANPGEVCAGQSDCIQHSTYKGKAMCTIVTSDKNVSYARLGEQFRDCLK